MRYLGTWNTPGNADELNLTNETGRAKKKIPLDKRTRSQQKLKTEHRRDKDRLDMKRDNTNTNHELVR